MKKTFIFLALAILAYGASAQVDTTGINMLVPERSPEVFSHDHICNANPTEGICEVVIRCESDRFPIEFIQDERVLKVIHSPEEIINGMVSVHNVGYEQLQNGFRYQLDVKNPVGRTSLLIQRGE